MLSPPKTKLNPLTLKLSLNNIGYINEFVALATPTKLKPILYPRDPPSGPYIFAKTTGYNTK